MKLSVSLPDDDVALLDKYALAAGLPSRSAALHKAVQVLLHIDLEQNYADAWQEWEDSGEDVLWEVTSGDGVLNA